MICGVGGGDGELLLMSEESATYLRPSAESEIRFLDSARFDAFRSRSDRSESASTCKERWRERSFRVKRCLCEVICVRSFVRKVK